MMKKKGHPWLAVLILGAFYCLIAGLAFTAFASWSHSVRGVFAWRLSSFLISIIAFAAHIAYEHFQLGNKPTVVGRRTGLAVALGAFGLAVAANIHSLGVSNRNTRLLALALIIWPVMTAVPAFVAAFVTAHAIIFFRRRA